MSADRALFARYPRLEEVVPFLPLADGFPTPVTQVDDNLWVKWDNLTDSRYGGNKVRKLEHLLAVAARRGGPVLTCGATGSHHVVATAIHAAPLGLSVEAVRFPQPTSPHVLAMAARAESLGVKFTNASTSTMMPLVLARRWAALTGQQATLITPGGSTPLGVLGYVNAGLELVESFKEQRWDEPDEVVVALGSGGSGVGLAVGMAIAGWRHCRVISVRVADTIVTNRAVLTSLELGLRQLLLVGGIVPPPARWEIDGRYFGDGYGYPTIAATEAADRAMDFGIQSEPTYTAKALAAVFARVDAGRRTVFLQTYAG